MAGAFDPHVRSPTVAAGRADDVPDHIVAADRDRAIRSVLGERSPRSRDASMRDPRSEDRARDPSPAGHDGDRRAAAPRRQGRRSRRRRVGSRSGLAGSSSRPRSASSHVPARITRRTHQPIVELDQVRATPDGDPAAIRRTDERRRVRTRSRYRSRQADPGMDEVPDRRIKRDDRTRERRRSGQRRASLDHLDLEPTDTDTSVTHPGQRKRVAHEHQPVTRFEPRDQGPERRVDVVSIGDELDEDVVGFERARRQDPAIGGRYPASR